MRAQLELIKNIISCCEDDVLIIVKSYMNLPINIKHSIGAAKSILAFLNSQNTILEIAIQDARIYPKKKINYINIKDVLAIPHLHELNIGHSIISRALMPGMGEAVAMMKELNWEIIEGRVKAAERLAKVTKTT